ncbi:MAG: hypothetical protein AAGA81_23775, partial [Acidobacteriota bacterium]
MRVEGRPSPKICLLWALLVGSSFSWAFAVVTTDGFYSINGRSTPNIEYAAAESFEITGLGVLISENTLPDDAAVDVIVVGTPVGIQVVIPGRATGSFRAQGLFRVPAGSAFGYRWSTADPGAVRSVPNASAAFTLHTQPLPTA